jgi:beta-N-acetylhexosaminidase
MIDIEGTALSSEDRELLQHPLVSGIILFSRNYASAAQFEALIQALHTVRSPRLLIAVDHEGGRVQRFRSDNFTHLPPARRYGQYYDHNPIDALHQAHNAAWLMAVELRAQGIDFSFAPVLDLDGGVSSVIGDRAFHSDPQIVTALTQAFIAGMQHAGIAAIAKHFPGHGSVQADSHHELPHDARSLAEISARDLIPFTQLAQGAVAGMMVAHVRYPAVDQRPATFSPVWLGTILRKQLGFQGVIVSDDLSMAGAAWAGDYLSRAEAAEAAGCELLLACNQRASVITLLDKFKPVRPNNPKLASLRTTLGITPGMLRLGRQWRTAVAQLETFRTTPTDLASA